MGVTLARSGSLTAMKGLHLHLLHLNPAPHPEPPSQSPPEPQQTLWVLNASCEPELQLGKNWDIDFLKMPTSPCCLRVFSQFWQVGESVQEVKDFEGELEVCCSPWQSPFDSH